MNAAREPRPRSSGLPAVEPRAPSAVRPVDRLLGGYNTLLAGTWAVVAVSGVAAHWSAWAAAAAAAHAGAALYPRWLARSGAPGSRSGRLLFDLYPLLALAFFFEELGPLLPFLHAGTHDGAVEALDGRLFGLHLQAVWMPAMPWPWLSEAMFALYFAYYALIYVPPLVLAVRREHAAVADTTLRLMATYLACFAVYLAYPVVGPHLTTPAYHGALTAGPFYRLVHLLHARGDAAGTAFPSSHVAGAIAIALACRRWMPGAWARITAVAAVGVAAATVYTRNHYAVDVVAGLVLVGLVHLGLPALRAVLADYDPAPAQESRTPLPNATGAWRERAGGPEP